MNRISAPQTYLPRTALSHPSISLWILFLHLCSVPLFLAIKRNHHVPWHGNSSQIIHSPGGILSLFFFFFSLVKHKWFSGYTSVWFIFDLKLHKCFSVCCMHFYTYMLYIIRSKAYRKVFAKISGIVGNWTFMYLLHKPRNKMWLAPQNPPVCPLPVGALSLPLKVKNTLAFTINHFFEALSFTIKWKSMSHVK